MKDLINSIIGSYFGADVYLEENLPEGYDGYFVQTIISYYAKNGRKIVYEIDHSIYEIICDLSLLKGAIKK